MAHNWTPGTTILAVDDDPLTLLLLRARLELEGLRMLQASNGQEALDLLKTEHVDLVITDLMMPAMDGFRLIREIQELPQPTGYVPIIVLSVTHNEEDMVRCLSAGADDYLTKPLSPQILVEKLWRILQRSKV